MSGMLINLLAATTGGQITRAEAFLRRFSHYNPDARLIIVKDPQSLTFCDNGADWEVKNVSIGATRFRALRRIAWENIFLPPLMRKEKLDIYLTFSHYLPFCLGSHVQSIVGVSNLAPFSTEAWDVESNAVRFKMWLLRHSIISSTKRAHRVIALSNTCRRVLAEQGIDKSKITVIPNGVEVCLNESSDGIVPETPFNSPYILSVSHFHRYKNFNRLIEAYGLLPKVLRNRFFLVIVGKPYDRKYFDEIKELIVEYGMQSRIFIIPGLNRDELDSLYRNASLFVFPSLIENSPNILLEAMAYGLPILASNVDPMPEFGGEVVRYFNGLSADALSSKMKGILLDADGAANLGSQARERSKQYTWDAFTKSVVDLCSNRVLQG